MRFKDIKRHLTPYQIYARRKTTINHAFAAAIAPCDEFVAENVKDAMRLLGQDPEQELMCAYCDSPAETWDHVFATVKASIFSGAGHRIGNLLPCCKPCNSKKGNKSWCGYIESREADGLDRKRRIERIQHYLDKLFCADVLPVAVPEYIQLIEVRDEILRLMRRADDIAAAIRTKMREQRTGEAGITKAKV